MNWLAHILISQDSIEYQLGNLLADPLKGKVWSGASKGVREGFRMHGRIDAFTDANQFVSKSKSRLGSRGYLKGVIVDIAYDHLLMNHWDEYSHVDIDTFINRFYRNAAKAITNYPDKAQNFVQRIIASELLTSYATLEGVSASLRRIDNRLSPRILAKETASGYLPLLEREIGAMQRDFSLFFPQLISHFKSKVDGELRGHWLK